MTRRETHPRPAPALPAGRLRVLYVEDDPGDVGLLKRALRDDRRPLEVLSAPSLSNALDVLAREPVAAVLLDIGLPDATGLEGLHRVRACNDRVPVLVLTGRDDAELEQEAIRSGAQDYLLKDKLDSYHVLRAIRHAIERQENMEAMARSDLRYALMAEASGDGLWDWYPRTGEANFSRGCRAALGWDMDEPRRLDDWYASLHHHDVAMVREAVDDCVAAGSDGFELECRLEPSAGAEERWIRVRGFARRDTRGRTVHVCCHQRDVTEQKRAEERMRRDAYYDAVTGLPNRALLIERIRRSLHRSERHGDQRFALLFADIDDFKRVNDSLGHESGDAVLREVALRVSACVRPEDTVARLGGDEFVILLENAPALSAAVRVAERITAALSTPMTIMHYEVYARASIGISLGGGDRRTAEDLLREADTALYRAKSSGGGYEVFDRSMHADAVAQLQLEGELMRGIDRDEFVAYYQPIVDLRTGRLAGFEALVRWHHPLRGVLSPGVFLGAAHAMRLVDTIDRLVLAQACEWLVALDRRTPAARHLTVSVNRSVQSLYLGSATADVIAALAQSGLEPQRLRLEISEEALLTDAADMRARLEVLRDLGVSWHLDDFGTGYSSLAMLGRFSIQGIKFDRSFVERIEQDGGAQTVVRHIAALARDLGMDVVAEGIETEYQRERLRAFDCPHGQGYLISPALPPDAAASFAAQA